MKKYLVKLLFNVSVGLDAAVAEFDEQLRLVHSNSIEDAFYKARVLGKKEEESFIDNQNREVTWKFIDVADIFPLEAMDDGEQLYSNSVKVNDPDSYISYIRRKSMELQIRNLSFA